MQGSAVTLNLEDTRLYGFGPEDFATLQSILDRDYPGAAVYLDEVQEAPEWQRLVRALLDSGRRVCVTGSNASLLGNRPRNPIYRGGGIGARVHAWKPGYSPIPTANASGHYA